MQQFKGLENTCPLNLNNSYPLAATPSKTIKNSKIGLPAEDDAETTGSSIFGVAIEPADNDVAANENAAANKIFFILCSNFNHLKMAFTLHLKFFTRYLIKSVII